MSYGVLGIIPGIGAANPPNNSCVGTQEIGVDEQGGFDRFDLGRGTSLVQF